MHHVEITKQYWNDFVGISKGIEGCYCFSCVTFALNIAKASFELNEGLAIRDNAQFDLVEYGMDMGGETESELFGQYNAAISVIQTARRSLDAVKKNQEAKCKKI